MNSKWEPGSSRLTKVLLQNIDGSADGHRGYPIAIRKRDGAMIVVAATEAEPRFMWGRFYLVEIRDPAHHPYVVGEVRGVPHEEDWELAESAIDDRAGHKDDL